MRNRYAVPHRLKITLFAWIARSPNATSYRGTSPTPKGTPHQMTTTPTPLDYLKYVSAEGRHLLEYVIDRLGGLDLDRPLREDAIEELQTMLDEVRDMLVEATSTFCPTPRDVNTYSDGRRKVETFVEMECGNIFGYRWHPNPTSPGNRARTLLDRHECTVIIAADQVLDVVTHERGLHLVDNHE